jgi:large subunit ribosomal protein L28
LTSKGKKGKIDTSVLIITGKKEYIMAARCELTGKGKQFGNNVSFSLRRTNRVFKPNLQKKTFMFEGQKVTMVLSTDAIRTLKKKGILPKKGESVTA